MSFLNSVRRFDSCRGYFFLKAEEPVLTEGVEGMKADE